MSTFKGLSYFAREWRQQRSRRRTEAMLAALPPELQRDIGWPVMELHAAVKTRLLAR